MIQYIYADEFFYLQGVKKNGYLKIENGKFGEFQTEKPTDGEIIDYSGYYIAPGLVDTHIHGSVDYDIMDAKPEGLHAISDELLSIGVTSFLPTTLTASVAQLDAAVKVVGDHHKELKGSKVRGIFLEGPFFTEEHKGAQNPIYFSTPSMKLLEQWQNLSGGLVRKIAVAAEKEGANEFIKEAVASGVVVALGHTNATYEQAKDSVEAGASIFVHTFNGMRGFSHREPGVVGAAMTLQEVFAELICDGHHVHPVAVKVLMDVRGRDHVALITDCMRAGSMPPGEYTLGDFPVWVKDGAVRLESGSLAGSILKLKDAVKNVVSWGAASPAEAIMMASYIPAVSTKIDDVCGQIKPGYDADFIVLDSQMNLCHTYLDGEKRYSQEA